MFLHIRSVLKDANSSNPQKTTVTSSQRTSTCTAGRWDRAGPQLEDADDQLTRQRSNLGPCTTPLVPVAEGW